MTSSEKSSVASEQSSMDSKITSLNSKQQAITSQKNTNETNINTANDKIEDAKTALEEAERQLAFDKTVDTYDLESQELNVEQKENALYDAKQNLSDYYIKAPFSGVVAEVGVNVGDNISSSSSIATLITKEQIAEISLNEIDIAKLEVGQKATLTFDAVEDLTIAGEVIEVGAIGTTNQGVVSYAVKIIFNNQDDRIKSGMSTSANIITSAKQDVIMVSSSAIKTANGTSYVLSPNNENIDSATISTNAVSLKNKPIQKTVEVGESNDSYTEIVSGLEEGDVIVLKSVTATTSTKASTSTGQSLFQIGGGNNRGGATAK
jgi:HlyD family secretion protein